MKTNGKTLALFDLDGTITKKDTLFAIIQYIHGKPRFYIGLIYLSPFIILYKVGLLPNWKAKEKILIYFFKNLSFEFFQHQCNQFAANQLPQLLKKDALKTIKSLQNEGAEIIVVSASAENWISPWCTKLNISCIATKLEIKKGKITGKIAGRNCHGIEKVNRIKEVINLSEYTSIYAYGDSKGDVPMLNLANQANYRTFK